MAIIEDCFAGATGVIQLYAMVLCPVQEMKSSDWDRIHGILSAQYREDSSPIPPWLSLDRVSWIDVTDTNNPRLVAVATGNLSLHTNDASGSSSSSDDGSGDLINVGDISMPYFALSKIIDLAVREEDAGKTLTYRCHYDDMDSAIIGALISFHTPIYFCVGDFEISGSGSGTLGKKGQRACSSSINQFPSTTFG